MWVILSYLGLCFCAKHYDHKKLGEHSLFNLRLNSHSWKETWTGTQGRNLEAGVEVGAVESAGFLIQSTGATVVGQVLQ